MIYLLHLRNIMRNMALLLQENKDFILTSNTLGIHNRSILIFNFRVLLVKFITSDDNMIERDTFSHPQN